VVSCLLTSKRVGSAPLSSWSPDRDLNCKKTFPAPTEVLVFPSDASVLPTALSWLSSANSLRDKCSPAAVSPSIVSPSLRRSVFYPVASPVALFLLAAADRFFFDCARYATLMCLLFPPMDASAWSEISLALVGEIVAY